MNVLRWLALTAPLALAASAAAGPPEPPRFPVRQVLPGPPGPIELPPPAVEAVDAAAAAAAAAAFDEAVESSGGAPALPGAAGSAVSEALSEAEAAAAGAAAVSAQETDLTGAARGSVPNAGALPAVPAAGPPAAPVPADAAAATGSPAGMPAPGTAGAAAPAEAPAATTDADDEAVSATVDASDAADEPAADATDTAATADDADDEAATGSAAAVPAQDPASPPAPQAAEPSAAAVASPTVADVPAPADAAIPAHDVPGPSTEASAPESPTAADAVPAAATAAPATAVPVVTTPASPAPAELAPAELAPADATPAEAAPAEAAAEPAGADAAVGPVASDAADAPESPGQTGAPGTAAATPDGEAAEPAHAEPTETGIAAEPRPPESTEPIATEAAEPTEIETATEPAGSSDEAPSEHAAPAEAAAGDHGEQNPPPARAEALPATPLDPETSPVRLVRTLQQLQDQMARGSTLALKAQRGMLNKIEAKFAAVPAETWQEPENAYALVTFVLSGGNPAPLRAVLSREPLPPIDERLMRGVLAYTDGREEAAAEQLAGVDPLSVPASMGAQVALAKAALAVGGNAKDTKLSIGLLDTARLLAPGTLAEEAALRREIFVVSQLGDIVKFELLSTQYLNRFRHSVYAGNFRQRFAAALTRMDFVNDPKEFGRLDTMISDLDDESRLEIYLLVARAAVNRGRTNATILAAERAQAIAEPGSVAGDRARLYRAASLVVTAQGLDDGIAELAAIDPARLPKDDAALHQAATSTAQLIINAPDIPAVPTTSDAAAATADAGSIPGLGDGDLPEVASRAQDALATVDDLLKRSTR